MRRFAALLLATLVALAASGCVPIGFRSSTQMVDLPSLADTLAN